MNYSTIQHMKCTSILDNKLIMLQFKINVDPSMKTKVINATMEYMTGQLDEFHTVFVTF